MSGPGQKRRDRRHRARPPHPFDSGAKDRQRPEAPQTSISFPGGSVSIRQAGAALLKQVGFIEGEMVHSADGWWTCPPNRIRMRLRPLPLAEALALPYPYRPGTWQFQAKVPPELGPAYLNMPLRLADDLRRNEADAVREIALMLADGDPPSLEWLYTAWQACAPADAD